MSSSIEGREHQAGKNTHGKGFKAASNEVVLDVEYAISSNFLKHISSSLLSKQLQVINRSNHLLEQLENSKALESTVDLTMSRSQISLNSIPDDLNPQQECSRKLISRKSPKALPGDLQLQRCLKDIQENCSPSTLASIRNIVEDMRKMRKRIIELQATQKAGKMSKTQTQKLEQENMILKSRIKELKEASEQLERQKKQLQIHIKEGQEDRHLTHKFTEIKKFINDKEKSIDLKVKKVTEICKGIESALEAPQLEEACQRCCGFMRRIKGSLVQYREYLSERENHLQALYNQYKKTLFGQA